MSSYLVCNIVLIKNNKDLLYSKEFDFNQLKYDIENVEEIYVKDNIQEIFKSTIDTSNSYDFKISDLKAIKTRINEIESELKKMDEPTDYSLISQVDFSKMSPEDGAELFMSIKNRLEDNGNTESYKTELECFLENYKELYYGMRLLYDMYSSYEYEIEVYLHTKME